MAVEQFEKSNGDGTAPVRPKAHLDSYKLFRVWLDSCKSSIAETTTLLLLVAVLAEWHWL
jgi:hypothetical protein